MTEILKWASIDDQWDLVRQALHVADRAYLEGDPGLGKSYAALYLSSGPLGPNGMRDVFNQTFNEDLSVQELMGIWAPSKAGVAWVDGPIVAAMRAGSILILNEIHRASPSVHDFLLGVLDNEESCMVTTSGGGTVRPSNGFKVIATSNVPITKLPKALANRFEVSIKVTAPNPALVKSLNDMHAHLGDLVANSYSGKGMASPIGPRLAISWAKMCKKGLEPKAAALAVFQSYGETLPADFINVLEALT